IAGYLTYELGALLNGTGSDGVGAPLLALGMYDAPREHRPREGGATPARISALLPTMSYQAYACAVASILHSIYDGDVYQVNLTVPHAFSLDGDAQALWESVARTTHAPYQAFVSDGAGDILSWSPELFLDFEDGRITTKPMKGTALPSAPHELLSAKNLAEHVMIVDLLRNDLGRIASDVSVATLGTVETYPTFLTMTSTITGKLPEDWTFERVVRNVFPCGSITGAPKRSAIEHIANLENARRDVYCGSIGYLSPHRQGWWNVAIRTARVQGSTGIFHAGGGIVSDSEPTEEWKEIQTKTSFLRTFSSSIELWETFSSVCLSETLWAHLARLSASALEFGIAYDCKALKDAALELCARERCVRRLRLRLHADGSFTTSSETLDMPLASQSVCLSSERVSADDPFLRHKTSWRPAHDRAWNVALKNNCFDAILCNASGHITEGSRTNIFVEIDGAMWTPSLECGLLPGILRSRLVSEGRARERILTRADLESADAIYAGNSARGLLRVRLVSIDDD
ncbi:MAG: chorismate-binding protein, partial [Candidatus Eremiobacteraeota bacterium]|nr:chorismate-binding protein [Candidatus Eremiobacteraeota bacterium]